MGVFFGPPEHIVLEFDARIAAYVRGRVWHDSQQLTAHDDGRVTMTLDVSNDWALRSWILGFGAAVRVVSPATLAETIAAELESAVGRYRSSRLEA